MTVSPKHVIAFRDDTTTPSHSIVDDPAAVETPYRSKSWRHFTNPEKGAIAGIWEAERHLERCKCDYDELCHIIEGRVRLTDSDGRQKEFGPGDSFVVASGFDGTWENLTPVRKVFFILS